LACGNLLPIDINYLKGYNSSKDNKEAK